jgi:hypothetical protein
MSIGRSSHTLGRHEEEPEDAEPGKAGPVRVHPIAVSNKRHGRSVSFLNNTKTATFFCNRSHSLKMKATPTAMSEMPGRESFFPVFVELQLTYLNSKGLRGSPFCVYQAFHEIL